MEPKRIEDLSVQIFADGADKQSMLDMYALPHIKGLTTNPTLMRKAGVTDYRAFCQDVLGSIRTKPISFEVFSDDFDEMERQAEEIGSWGDNVYVKLPVTNTKGESSVDLVRRLAGRGVKLNITALMTMKQTEEVADALEADVPSYISIFAGRIADTGRDPLIHIKHACDLVAEMPAVEIIWASPRELLNIFQADEMGCHVITVTSDILKKLNLVGYDLDQYSLDTVSMFYNDARAAAFNL